MELTPDAIAVVFEDRQLTYRQLNQEANQLANYLKTLGVKSEVLVGICVERSFEMIVGLLGILKAGGAYVPLDPAYPQERLAFMLADAQVSVLLTQEKLLEYLPNNTAKVVCLDSDRENIAQYSQENLISQATEDNLAYVIYTSGSTGTPKGVMIQHKSLVNYTEAVSVEYQLNQNDKILQFASISFDISVEEIYPCLAVGATLVLRTDAMLATAKTFWEKCQEWQITVLDLPTAYWHELTAALEREKSTLPSSIRLVIIGGEKALLTRLKTWYKYVGEQVRLVNTYEPTETTVSALMCDLRKSILENELTELPIGKPVSNTQAYILDSELKIVPVGTAGELYIGGIGLARGYLNRPDLTAEKFIPTPFREADEQGSRGVGEKNNFFQPSSNRVYRTGDLARYLPDGNIEYLGRIDHQVKIRGFRIELGEVEEVLNQHPAVQAAAVIDREDVPGQKRLVAYIVQNEQFRSNGGLPALESSLNFQPQSKLVPQIRSFLKQKLPDYMMPSAFVLLDALPLTPNGKIDRRSLPIPDPNRLDLEQSFVAPRTPQEEILASIWAEVLGLERVGIWDNFIELGGHSLLAIQIISRVRGTLQVELPLRSLFEAPTVAELATQLEKAQQEPGLQAPPLQRISRDQDLPVSFGQQQMWLFNQMEPNTPVYNEPWTTYLKGEINVAALEKALNEIIRRHEVLRTSFRTVKGKLVSAIAPTLTLPLKVIDLQTLPYSERESEALRLATEEARQLFDLSSGLLLRATLVQLDTKDYRLFLTTHHIVDDGISSFNIFVPELKTLYEAFSKGLPSPLPELPIQYADFAYWQRQWLREEVLEKQIAYWKQQLLGLPVLQLPTYRPKPAIKTFRGARQCLSISKSLTEELKALSRREGVTLFMMLLAAFKTLLYRYAKQPEIPVGTVTGSRNRPELEGLIGYFLNPLVLRTDMSGNPSFQQLLARVKEVCLGAYAHQDLPFEQLVQILQPERNNSQNPLFQVSFVLEPRILTQDGEWGLSQLDVDTGTSKLDLTLELDERAEGIIGRFEYNTDLFDAATIERMVGHYQTLLEGIVSDTNQRISDLPLLTTAEQQLLVQWNNTFVDYPQNLCLHQLFEAQVEKTPLAIAVVFQNQQLTYQQLNQQANQLAYYLQSKGVKPDTLIGICLERSEDMLIALLGVLKAGGAYVPLDPGYPAERLAYMVEDSQIQVLLTWSDLVEKLPQHHFDVICLDSDWEIITQQSQGNLINSVNSENLAYVIYTSGSTGKPKGVLISHHAICNHMLWMQRQFPLNSTDRVLQKTPFSFDASVWEFYAPLLVGASLIIAEPGIHRDSQALGDAIAKQNVSILQLVPSQLRLLLAEQNLNCQSLRRVFCGGEPLTMELVERFVERFNAKLINLYGPTECTIDATYWRVERGYQPEIIPIGRAIANVQTYILDSYLHPVPVGVPGELYIGGDGLARGYLNRPELTAEKFIPHPFSKKPGGRLYKTGDLVRYLPDGNIEYLGRIDQQVKLRGFRIELGEIEAAITLHPNVFEAVVMVREDIPNYQQLVAYIVPHQPVPINELRSFLKQKLPDYMQPSSFVILETLPLTPSGKIDRKALPAPIQNLAELEKTFVAARTPIEELLAGIWAEVLRLERICIYDNFFELGGHSLLGAQIISLIRNNLQRELPLKKLFECPTVASLAKFLETDSKEDSEQFPPILPVSREQHLPTSFTQQQMWLFVQQQPDLPCYNNTLLLRLPEVINATALEQALNEIIKRHEILRTNFGLSDGLPIQIIHPSRELKLAVVDLDHFSPDQQEEEANRLAKLQTLHLFDLSQDLLLRATLLRFNPTKNCLVLTIHHIVYDGVSLNNVFLKELEIFYKAYCESKPALLPELTVQYADYAVWQRQCLQQESNKRHLEYWQQKLANLSLLPLPTDRPRLANHTYLGASQPLKLSKDLTAKLKALAVREGVTLFMTLLSTFKTLLYRYTSIGDIPVSIVTADSNRPELSNLIGLFINILVLRTDLNGDISFRQLLKRVWNVTLEAYNHKDLPYHQLIETLPLEHRRLGQNPLFQVMFLLDPPIAALESGWTMRQAGCGERYSFI